MNVQDGYCEKEHILHQISQAYIYIKMKTMFCNIDICNYNKNK
jgi:hypothetical protein